MCVCVCGCIRMWVWVCRCAYKSVHILVSMHVHERAYARMYEHLLYAPIPFLLSASPGSLACLTVSFSTSAPHWRGLGTGRTESTLPASVALGAHLLSSRPSAQGEANGLKYRSHAGHMQVTCRSHAGHMQIACKSHAIHLYCSSHVHTKCPYTFIHT